MRVSAFGAGNFLASPESMSDTSEVPIRLAWTGSGSSVKVTGNFSGWDQGVPLERHANGSCGEELCQQVLYLRLTGSLSADAMVMVPKGKRVLFKFVVDGQWKYDPHQRW